MIIAAGLLGTATLAVLTELIWAQQPAGTQMYVQYPGLSDACKEALATNITCSPSLPVISFQNMILDTDGVNELCVNECYISLKKARAAIQAACTSVTDVIVYENVAYPATFISDNYLLTYETSCKKDKKGNFCDPQFLSWLNESTVMDSVSQCSDCWLGVMALQLNSPVGYDPGLANNFASLSSSCNATGYSFTSPAAYALNATATAVSSTAASTATATPTCTNSYTVQPSDDCKSASKAANVSTYSLLHANDLDLYCQNFATVVNTTLCIPPQCTTYTWKASDTCNSVARSHSGVTVPQFLAWNPNFNSLCTNGPFFIGYEVCVSPPGGDLNHTTGIVSNATEGTTATSIMPAPANALDGSNRNCSQWYTIVEGDTCARVSLALSISLADFYFLNPEIDRNCTNLLLDEAYCVKPVGSITTYPNYTITGVLPITVTPATFPPVNTAIPTVTNDPGYVHPPETLLPTAPGTISGCLRYESPGKYSTSCLSLAYQNEVSIDDLFDWNPSLERNASSCTLQSGNSYCVLRYSNSTESAKFYGSGFCLPIDAIEEGTSPDCNCFTTVSGDSAGFDECDDLADDYSITLSQLLAWNSWLAGDCDTALFANLNKTASRAVCIGVGDATSTIASSTVPGTRIQTATSVGPTQTGTVSGCQKFHTVQSADDCPSIEREYGITATQLYQWNPSIGSTCANLWSGYAYCVEGPVSSTAGPNAPTQTGIASNCNEYYTVVREDTCVKVETKYGITFAQMYDWNPAIGSNCESLVIGYSVCVGVSS